MIIEPIQSSFSSEVSVLIYHEPFYCCGWDLSGNNIDMMTIEGEPWAADQPWYANPLLRGGFGATTYEEMIEEIVNRGLSFPTI